jgi:hypothetical protein
MSGVELLVVVATVVGGVSTITNFVYSYWKNKKLTKQNKLIQLKLSELNQISSNEPINPELPNGNVDVAVPSPVENDADHREVKAFFNTKTKQIQQKSTLCLLMPNTEQVENRQNTKHNQKHQFDKTAPITNV